MLSIDYDDAVLRMLRDFNLTLDDVDVSTLTDGLFTSFPYLR